MRLEEIRNEINQLSMSDKILLVEDVWDTIAMDNSEISMSAWQKAELDKRYQEYSEGKLEVHDWKDVHQKLRNKFK